MGLWDYLKKEEVSPEYEKAKEKIMELHQRDGSLAYINWMSQIEEGRGEMQVEYVRGEMRTGEQLFLYDCQGNESGAIEIEELYIGKNEDAAECSENGEIGRIVFRNQDAEYGEFWKSQYAGCEKKEKNRKNC